MKTRGRRLMPDGERPGVWTERAWADERHPQRFVRVPPPDGLNYRPGPPPPHADGASVDLGWWMQSRNVPGVDGTMAQPDYELYRQQIPSLNLWSPDATVVFLPNVPGDLEWGGGAVLVWGGENLTWG